MRGDRESRWNERQRDNDPLRLSAVNDAPTSKFNFDELFLPVKEKQLRRVPRLIRVAFRLVWRAAPREFTFLAVVQFISGVGVALQLLAGRKVLAEVLASGDQGKFGDVLPSVILLAAVTAVVAFANLARVERQRILSELVSRHAMNRVLDVSTAVDLLAYESPAFHDRLQRAQVNAAIPRGQVQTRQDSWRSRRCPSGLFPRTARAPDGLSRGLASSELFR